MPYILTRRTACTRPARAVLNAASPQAKGLSAWWPLGYGPPRDLVAGLHTPTVQPSSGVTPRGVPVSGIGSALFFSGGRFAVPDTPTITSAEMTVAAWVLPTDLSGNGNFLGCNGNLGWRGRVLSTGAFNFLDRGGTNQISSTAVITTHRHWHLVTTAGAAGLALFVNGVPDNTNATAFGNAGTSVELGDSGVSSEAWAGYLIDVRVYARRLSAGEIWQLYSPTTRWDLYQAPSTRVFFDVGAEAAFIAQQNVPGREAVKRASYW